MGRAKRHVTGKALKAFITDAGECEGIHIIEHRHCVSLVFFGSVEELDVKRSVVDLLQLVKRHKLKIAFMDETVSYTTALTPKLQDRVFEIVVYK